MVAEENHSVTFDDLELTEKLLLLASKMNADHTIDPQRRIPSTWFTPYFHVGEKNASVNLYQMHNV